MKKIFWVCWSAEIAACFIWMLSELRPQYVAPSPYAFIATLYLIVAMAIRFAFDAEKISIAMIAVPVLPFIALRSALLPRKVIGINAH